MKYAIFHKTRMASVKIAIDYLEKRIIEIKDKLKNTNNDLSIELKDINNAINWLKKIEELKLKHVQKYDIIEMPDPLELGYGYSSYKIVIDNESGDIKYGTELKINNKPVEAIMGDILIIKK